ncbi:hypothetical protein AX14_008744, partial [Amanita brunnescens Koide BX004]
MSTMLKHFAAMASYGTVIHGHDPSPENDYQNTRLFPSLYPTLYPYGVGGFEDDNQHPRISMKAHVRHLMNMADGRFREHPSFFGDDLVDEDDNSDSEDERLKCFDAIGAPSDPSSSVS